VPPPLDVKALRVVSNLDANFGWSDGRLLEASLCQAGSAVPNVLRGAFACVSSSPDGRHRIMRDPLGINKLFWSAAHNRDVWVGARPKRLVDVGCRFENIHAFAAGWVIDLDLSTASHATQKLAGAGSLAAEEQSIELLASEIRSSLDRYCDALAGAHVGATVFVCLSGGVDSSGIAVLAREHFRNVVAVSFDLHRDGGAPSEDRLTAERLSRDIGIPLVCVTVTADQLLAPIDMVLTEAIDWRDFNVHAALVSAALAEGIAATANAPALVLSGDLPNEFLVDYEPETYDGREYYRLPKLSPAALRSSLVRGLETSHREVGPFQAWGLPLVQPYSVAVDQYMALPPRFLQMADRKELLSRMIFGDRIPSYVYARPKTRAQVGGATAAGGVLGTCVNRGIDGGWLRRRFAELHRVTDLAALDRFIRGGRYRAAIPMTSEVLV
jgi:asparagine synthetase B (glutamine-hydrolysing)